MPNKNEKRWIAGVKTVSTYPPPGLFTKSATTIARMLASKEVSPKGPVSGLRMLTYFINRAGSGLSAERRASWKKPRRCCRNGSSAKRRHAKLPPDAALPR